MRSRLIIIGVALLLGLAWVNWQVLTMERHAVAGRPIFFELNQENLAWQFDRDRLLLQYALINQLPTGNLPVQGELGVTIDEKGVATAARILTPEAPLAAGEVLVDYRLSGFVIGVGPDRFEFQEDSADSYRAARYAELRVLPDGSTLLVGLRDAGLTPLGAGVDQ